MSNQLVGIMGGTFDPIHFGHLRPALEIAEALQLSEVRFIPARLPALKDTPQTPVAQRLAMVRLALAGQPLFRLDSREITRQGTSYTVDTLQQLVTEYPHTRFAFILGADAFAQFKQWKDWQGILQRAHLIVSHRPGYRIERHGYPASDWVDDAQSLYRHRQGKILPLAVTPLQISSTFIRERVASGQSIQYLVPEKVRHYIEEEHLYRR